MSDRTLIKPTGWFCLDVWQAGRLIERIDEPNAIVIGYLDTAARAIGGLPNGAVTQFGIGTNTASAAFGNTALTGAFLKPFDAVSLVGGNSGKVTYAFSLASSEGNGLAIAEFGLLTASEVLFARKARTAPPLIKDTTISFAGTWTISFVGA